MRPAQPDILLLVTTQWRAQTLGHAGDADAHTPALDALAADPRSLRHTEAVTPHPFGPFAFAALLTGLPSPANGLRDYWDSLPTDAPTLADRLADEGYSTTFVGKWPVAPRDPALPLVGEAAARLVVPPDRRGGFARWRGFGGGFLLNNPWLHGDGIGDGLTPEQREGHQADALTNEAASLLESDPPATGPRFLLLCLEPPHPPYAADTPTGIRRPAPDTLRLPPQVPRGGEIEQRARRELAGYHAHLSATDAALGRFIARADADAARRGRPAPLIVFTSLHGDMHGAHGLFRKGWPHEESVRVPFLVRGAPGRSAGTTRQPVSLLDLPDMLAAWAAHRPWSAGRDRIEISMPCVVALPDQCDRIWNGWRSADDKRIFHADGTPWILPE